MSIPITSGDDEKKAVKIKAAQRRSRGCREKPFEPSRHHAVSRWAARNWY